MSKIFCILLLIPMFLFSQEKETQDVWEPLDYFIGAWEGEGGGDPGIGKSEREYELILKDKFIHFKNTSTFEPQEKNPEGEVHVDWGFFSHDKGRDTFVLRQFYGEGFVNQFVMDTLFTDGKTAIFVTEKIENGPSGLHARLTFSILDQDEFIETFELAPQGKEFRICIQNRWKRKN